MRVQKWEYLTTTVTGNFSNTVRFNEKLNEYGQQGYELCGVYNLNFNCELKTVIVFKRPCGFIYFDIK